jgi:formate dehydrogenase maturation protein FdhE
VLFVKLLSGLETVVELPEEAVQQVPLCGGMPVSVLASASVVRVRSR